jgi:tRNA threonylcarbamoyladenosine biosynthesis protein TsaE
MSISAESTVTVVTASPDATRRLAETVGRRCRGGEVIALDGPLGAGKTTFTKGLAAGLDIDPRDVTSPTFLLLHELRGRLRLGHLDAYRVGDAEELAEIGARESFREDAVVVIEWAERVRDLLPADRLAVTLDYAGEGEEDRRLAFRATGPRHAELLPDLPESEEA